MSAVIDADARLTALNRARSVGNFSEMRRLAAALEADSSASDELKQAASDAFAMVAVDRVSIGIGLASLVLVVIVVLATAL